MFKGQGKRDFCEPPESLVWVAAWLPQMQLRLLQPLYLKQGKVNILQNSVEFAKERRQSEIDGVPFSLAQSFILSAIGFLAISSGVFFFPFLIVVLAPRSMRSLITRSSSPETLNK